MGFLIPGGSCGSVIVFRANTRQFTSSIVPAHTQWRQMECVCQCSKVVKGEMKGEEGIVDVKIRVVKSLTPTASFSNLSCESVIHRCHYVIIVDFFVCLFFKVDFMYLNLVDL